MTTALVKQPIVWVNTKESLIEWCERWKGKKLLAIDTEFMRSQTYFPIAALIQVNDGESNVLIDPTEIDDLTSFSALMQSKKLIKAIHSCSEDLEVFQRIMGILPAELFDTQIAAAALGYGFSVGYGNLVKAAMDVELPKSETRSDWLQRPLSQAQINYAAIDVEYLFGLAEQFIIELNQKNRSSWVSEECEKILESFADAQVPKLSYQRVKTAWKLDARQLACLVNLCEWRETKAQMRDVPRNRVVKENALFQIALKQPKHISQLRHYEGLTERMIRSDGEDIMNILEKSLEIPEAELPNTLPRPPSGEENRNIKILRERVCQLAEELNVAPELLVKKKDYEFIVKNVQKLPPNLTGWRKPVVGEKLLEWCDSIRQEGDNLSEQTEQ